MAGTPVEGPRPIFQLYPIDWLHSHDSWGDPWKLPAHIITYLGKQERLISLISHPSLRPESSWPQLSWPETPAHPWINGQNDGAAIDLLSLIYVVSPPSPDPMWSHFTRSIWGEASKLWLRRGVGGMWQPEKWSLSKPHITWGFLLSKGSFRKDTQISSGAMVLKIIYQFARVCLCHQCILEADNLFHRFTDGEEFCHRMNHSPSLTNTTFRWYLA